VLVIRVDIVAAESVLARLQRLVDEAQRDKAPLQRIADRVSAIFVPVVLAATGTTFLIWWLVVGDFGKAVLSAVALLLVACPCAMGLAAPVAMMVGLGRASSMGILVRSSDALERLARAETVVFDKTGTLTERFATVQETMAMPGTAEDEVLALAAPSRPRAIIRSLSRSAPPGSGPIEPARRKPFPASGWRESSTAGASVLFGSITRCYRHCSRLRSPCASRAARPLWP